VIYRDQSTAVRLVQVTIILILDQCQKGKEEEKRRRKASNPKMKLWTGYHIRTLQPPADNSQKFRQFISIMGLSSLYISIVFAALVVFISSRSFVCSFISALSIYFILVTAIATLVGLGEKMQWTQCPQYTFCLHPFTHSDFFAGWELGFLEWVVCFAILVGISADFVIHLSNSYCQLSGHCSKEERTRYALISMGPSI
jgi:hypothetical protein